jgi:CheY-like chemotaxis protein
MESIGQLTGGVAHDFNNLLTIIIGNLERIQRRLDKPEANAAHLKESAANALLGAQRAATLTRQLLAFSRRQALDPKLIDVNRLVAGMSDLLRRTLGERIDVVTVLDSELWQAHADPNQLEGALLNLAVNARDAMTEGGKLTIKTANAELDERYARTQEEQVAPGQYVAIMLTDTGTGMSPDVMARVFEPFFTTKDIGHGTGLGLSQVYGFVKQSGGHVNIYSEPGQGTTVKLYLPRHFAGAHRAEVIDQPANPPGNSSETILVVEDDPDVRAHSVEVLRELGYRVLEAPDAQAAMECIRQESDITLLFTDVGLPGGMDGRQLATAAKCLRPKLKVLLATGYARSAIMADGRLDAGGELITKPFEYSALAKKLRDILDRRAALCVLVVEDEPLVRMTLVDDLKAMGLRVEQAGSATEALSKASQAIDGIDGAIIDVGLPDRKGDTLALELRARYAALPLIIASGYGEAAMPAGIKSDPRVRLLVKPYDRKQLEVMLHNLGLLARTRAAT